MGAVITTLLTIATSLFSSALDVEFWCKWIISYFYIKLLKRRTKKRFDLYDVMIEHDPYKVNFLPPPEEYALESPLPESQLVNTADEVFCYGTNSKSECLTIHVSRRPDNKSDAWIRLQMSDGRTYERKETSGFQQSGSEKRVFSCGDLQMHYISPMRRWRIFFNGLMREKNSSNKSSERMVYVKFALLWRASSDTFDFTTDVSTTDLAAALAKAKWNKFLPPLAKLYSALNIYTQTGVIFGHVTIEGDEEDHNMYLFGEKMRFLGDIHLAGGMELFQVLGRTTKDGRFLHLVEVSIPDIVEKLRFGFMVLPTGVMKGLTDAAIAIENLSRHKTEKVFETKFHVEDDNELFELKGSLVGEQALLQTNNDRSESLTIDHIHLQMNSFEGKGIILQGNMKKQMKRAIPTKSLFHASPVFPDVVHFSDKTCQNSEITGAKGSSLGKLTELSKKFQNFVVPNGIVLTTAAYKKFLSREVIQEIKTLENFLCSDQCDDIKAACQKVIEKVIESTFPDDTLEELTSKLKKAFPDKKNTLKFAVRSSATGEDTDQMSAAGQMETYLGVSGIDEIISAVKKCWASQFSHIAVQYKRQNGQLLNTPMAVVIQQMVSCDVAGVLFTCDPLTGNPTNISITANYGLGESVVSGSEEPDTIELKRNEDDKLVVENKIIGSKRRRIVLKESDEGTNTEDVPEHERATCCLTDEMSLRLGELAVKLQRSYRSHRDIEWGFWNNNLYIFQSRPVTSGTGESDFEIDHEQDAPLRIEDEYFTVCNVGEVMPGATSPLGLDVQIKFFNLFFQRPRKSELTFGEKKQYFPHGMCSMYNHVMFYCLEFFRRAGDKNSELGFVSMFGRILEDEDMFEAARIRFEIHKTKRSPSMTDFIHLFIRILFGVKRTLRKGQKTYANYRIPVEKYNTSQDLFDALMYACTDLNEAFLCHMVCSEASSVWIIFLFAFLRNVKGELNSDVYADFAHLLKTCSEVESADVPASLEELSRCISKDIEPESFKKMNTNEAVSWLQSSTSKSGLKYREFLEKHGHRCLKESDIHSKTWQTDPNSLVTLLQNTVGNVKIVKTENAEDFNTLVSKLKTPLDFKQRLTLRILLPLSRQSVQLRETSKSLLIRNLDAWRKGFTRLSELMVSEGRIPDSDLLFFMTLEDVKELLQSRSPRIIAKANHRRRRHPILDKYIFQEISKGVPVPINLDTQPVVSSDDSLLMKGVPVSQGETTGFVRVAITLEEAALLQPGEILVTYSTDIGWSPYFPFLAGVVTELGGLISHGAVVSREYGLPCVAGLHGATRQFQTGDYALLDGTKGFLQKLPKPGNS